MFNEVLKIVSGFCVISNRKLTIVCQYLMGLTIKMKKHSFEAISKMVETHPSRFSYLLNDPETVEIAKSLFNRAQKLFAPQDLKNLYFLTDSGYDVKKNP